METLLLQYTRYTIPIKCYVIFIHDYFELQNIFKVQIREISKPLWLFSALIYVIDSSKPDRLSEAYNELAKLLQEKELKDASLLIFANKQVISSVHA